MIAASPAAQHAPVPACRAEVLNVRLGASEGAAGTIYYAIVFTNTGPTGCAMTGYPGVSSTDAQGRPIGAPAARNRTSTPRRVVLRPGGSASAAFGQTQALNYPKARCRPAGARALRIYPPDETRSRILALKHLTCSRRSLVSSTIGAVVAGVTGVGK